MDDETEREAAGEPACALDRVCPVCGGLEGHRSGCTGEP